jgi:hypothetical protein
MDVLCYLARVCTYRLKTYIYLGLNERDGPTDGILLRTKATETRGENELRALLNIEECCVHD